MINEITLKEQNEESMLDRSSASGGNAQVSQASVASNQADLKNENT